MPLYDFACEDCGTALRAADATRVGRCDGRLSEVRRDPCEARVEPACGADQQFPDHAQCLRLRPAVRGVVVPA